MNYFTFIPMLVHCIEWFIRNEPDLEKDAVRILSNARDILLKLHDLRNTAAAAEGQK